MGDVINIDSKDKFGRTPLYGAVCNGHVKVVSVLLRSGADPTEVPICGNTSLHRAVSKGYKSMVEILLQYVKHHKLRSFVNAETTLEGNTSLHIAAENGLFDIGKSLLVHGAICNIKNKNGKTPLDLSQNQSFTYLLELAEELLEDAINENLEFTNNILDRVGLLRKLSKSDIFNQNAIGLDNIHHIAKYLSDDDLINFILAFYYSKKRPNQIQDDKASTSSCTKRARLH